jgi:hypothetical protein
MKKLVIIGTALVALGGPLVQSAGAMPADVTPVVQQQNAQPLPAVALELGQGQRFAVQGMTPAEQRALTLRSEGLNQKYHLGAYKTGVTPAEYRALMLRSEALNQRYGLGGTNSLTLERGMNERFVASNAIRRDVADSSPTVTSSPDFQWGDAGIGAGVLLGLVALIGAGLFEVRHHGHGRLGTS